MATGLLYNVSEDCGALVLAKVAKVGFLSHNEDICHNEGRRVLVV